MSGLGEELGSRSNLHYGAAKIFGDLRVTHTGSGPRSPPTAAVEGLLISHVRARMSCL